MTTTEVWDILKNFDFKEIDSREMLKDGKQPNQTNFSMFFPMDAKDKIKEIKEATHVFNTQRAVVIFCISFTYDLFTNNPLFEYEVEMKEFFERIDNFSVNQNNIYKKNFSAYFNDGTKNKIGKIKELIRGLIQSSSQHAIVYFCVLMTHEIICKKRLNHVPNSSF